jgi:hypothetical protein
VQNKYHKDLLGENGMDNTFLEKNHRQMVEIVDYLQLHGPNVAITELEKSTALDRRALLRYIEEIAKTSTQTTGSQIEVNYQEQIVTLLHPSSFHEAELTKILIQQTVKYEILMRLFNDEPVSFSQFEYRFGISRSNYQKHMTNLKQFAEKFDIDINPRKSEPIRASEHQVRFFMHSILFSIGDKEFFTQNESIHIASEKLLRKFPAIDYFSLNHFIFSLAISLHRIRRGYFLSKEENYELINHPYLSKSDFFDVLKGISLYHEKLNEDERVREWNYLYFVFATTNLLPLSETNETNWVYVDLREPSVNYFLHSAFKNLPFTPTPDELNYLKINVYYLHQLAKSFKGTVQYTDAFKIDTNIERNFPKDFAHIEKFIDSLTENEEIAHLLEIFAPLRYHYFSLLSHLFFRHLRTVNVLIQSKISPLQLERLIFEIKSSTKIPLNILMSVNPEISPDCVISDWIPDKKFEHLPYFHLSNLKPMFQNDLNEFLYSIADGNFK